MDYRGMSKEEMDKEKEDNDILYRVAKKLRIKKARRGHSFLQNLRFRTSLVGVHPYDPY